MLRLWPLIHHHSWLTWRTTLPYKYLHHKIHLHVITECKLADAWVPMTIASLYGSQRFHCGFCYVNSPIFNYGPLGNNVLFHIHFIIVLGCCYKTMYTVTPDCWVFIMKVSRLYLSAWLVQKFDLGTSFWRIRTTLWMVFMASLPEGKSRDLQLCRLVSATLGPYH